MYTVGSIIAAVPAQPDTSIELRSASGDFIVRILVPLYGIRVTAVSPDTPPILTTGVVPFVTASDVVVPVSGTVFPGIVDADTCAAAYGVGCTWTLDV
jgi:hypothetical protein